MAFSINGFGTTFYGKAEEDEDGSYVVTEWVVAAFLPLIPLGSKRIWPVSQDDKPWWKRDVGEKFQVEKVSLHMPHLFKGYAVTLGIFLLLRLA